MRENRTYGLEGGGPQLNAISLPLSMALDLNRYLNREWKTTGAAWQGSRNTHVTTLYVYDSDSSISAY